MQKNRIFLSFYLLILKKSRTFARFFVCARTRTP